MEGRALKLVVSYSGSRVTLELNRQACVFAFNDAAQAKKIAELLLANYELLECMTKMYGYENTM